MPCRGNRVHGTLCLIFNDTTDTAVIWRGRYVKHVGTKNDKNKLIYMILRRPIMRNNYKNFGFQTHPAHLMLLEILAWYRILNRKFAVYVTDKTQNQEKLVVDT